MPGMGKHSSLSYWQVRAVAAVAASVAAGLALYSAAASYDTVSRLAAEYGLSLPSLTPIGLEGGLFGVILINILLIWLKKPVWWFGMMARFFAAAVIAANAAAGWPRPVGIGLRVAAPVLFITIVEAAQYVLLHHSDEATQERQRKREERIPLARWVLAPVSTFIIWRRKKLWTDSRLPQSAIDTELSVIRLAEFYGPEWRDKADADLVWMIQSGVNMDEVLDRVKKLTGTGPGRSRSRPAGTAGEHQAPAVPPVPAGPEPAASTARESAADSTEQGERTFKDLLDEARAYRDELAAAGERVSKDKLRLRFAIGSSKALELARTLREDEQDDTREAVI